MSKTTTHNNEIDYPYEMVGVYRDANNPEVIVGAIVEDKETNCRFQTSVFEARALVDTNKMKIPEFEN